MFDIEKNYNSSYTEDMWYKRWIQYNCFFGEIKTQKKPFSIAMPPPNITGLLTMGHVLNNTIQDVLIRHARQKGMSALWIPGTDHAGIATQTKIEIVLKNEGLNRKNLDRKDFLKYSKNWCNNYKRKIVNQMKRLGLSCDWSKMTNTFDEKYSHAVLNSFVMLFRKGYIYKGKKIINYCPVQCTALSDEEVKTSSRKTFIYIIRYDIVDQYKSFISIATTRPETIMGDTAIAVNPNDNRYNKLIGMYVWRPFPRKIIPIVGDFDVSMVFGTGAVKVTPGHDKIDFEIGKAHKLPIVNILNNNCTMNKSVDKCFRNIHISKIRNIIVRRLIKTKLMVCIKPYNNAIGLSERTNTPIEFLISEQWFLKYPCIKESKHAVLNKAIEFYPSYWVKNYLHWFDKIQDWCISRQIWWGHQIPVWYKKYQNHRNPKNWHVSIECPSDVDCWTQDENTLDTWASSWLWMIATTGWPLNTKKNQNSSKYWYPTNVLVTGPDIIFFWVARMIMASINFMKKDDCSVNNINQLSKYIPFRNVYFTSMIRDERGRKMSKSLGNSPELLTLIDKYGADGVRFGLLSIAPQGHDVLFNQGKLKLGRNFCNKIWNAYRFRKNIGPMYSNRSIFEISNRVQISKFDIFDHAIILDLMKLTNMIESKISYYAFHTSTQFIYAFAWNIFCDWYLEISKVKINKLKLLQNCLSVQDLCFHQMLLSMHPFTPFITERLWHDLGYSTNLNQFIQNVETPTSQELNFALKTRGVFLQKQSNRFVDLLRKFVIQARALKSQFQHSEDRVINYFINCSNEHWGYIKHHAGIIKNQIRFNSITRTRFLLSSNYSILLTDWGALYLKLKKENSYKVLSDLRVDRGMDVLKKIIYKNRTKFHKRTFIEKVSFDVVKKTEQLVRKCTEKIEKINKIIR